VGYSEPVIAALIGHQGRSTTSRYLHSADAVLLAAADAVANRTAQLMGEHSPAAQVVPLSARRDGLPIALKETDDVLKVPPWVPAPVAHLAHLMHEDATKRRADTECIELVRRLTCDPRMKRVWNELLRRKRANYRTTEAFLNPVRSGPQTFWTREARARRRRAEEIRTLADGEVRAEVKKLETWALFSEFAGTNYISSGWHIFSGYEGPKLDRQQHALAFLFHEAF